MKVTIESTDDVAVLEEGYPPMRVWQGMTESGIPVAMLVYKIDADPHVPNYDRGHEAFGKEWAMTKHLQVPK